MNTAPPSQKKLLRINPGGSKAVSFTRDRVKDPLNYFLGDQRIPKASSSRYLGIILRGDLRWADQVNYTVQNVGKALHFIIRVLKRENVIRKV